MTEYMVNGTPADEGRDDVAEVVIDGKVFPLTGGGTEYMQKVAAYIDGKIAALRKTRQFSRQNAEYRTVMIWLNLADDYFREKEAAERLRADRDAREGEIYSLKRELVEKRLLAEDAEKRTAEVRAEAARKAADLEEKTGRELQEMRRTLADEKADAGLRAEAAERESRELLAEAERKYEDAQARIRELEEKVRELESQVDELLEK